MPLVLERLTINHVADPCTGKAIELGHSQSAAICGDIAPTYHGCAGTAWGGRWDRRIYYGSEPMFPRMREWRQKESRQSHLGIARETLHYHYRVFAAIGLATLIAMAGLRLWRVFVL